MARNPMAVIPHPHVNERTIPILSMGDMANLLELVNPQRARTDNERVRKIRDRAALYILWDTLSRRNEITGLTMSSVDWDLVFVAGWGEVSGTDHLENLQLLCSHCNGTKGDRPQEYSIAKLKELA